MPHQCVTCGKFYDDGSQDILTGCSVCKCKVFFFIKKSVFEEKMKEQQAKGLDVTNILNLSSEDKKQIENDVYDLLGNEIDRTKPVILDIESIKILQPGKYELDLVNLFKKKQPLVYKLDDGKYMIDIVESLKDRFMEFKNKNNKK
jgi:uncharacterized protein